MKKFKQLEAWLLSKPEVYDWVVKAVAYLKAQLSTAEKARHVRYIADEIKALNLNSGAAAVTTVLANNTLDQIFLERGYNGGVTSTSSVPLKLFLDISIRTSIELYSTIGALVGIQPMKTPVAMMFSMQYKEKEETEEERIKREEAGNILGRLLSLEIVSTAVEAQSRKLMTMWSIEAVSDMKTMHKLDLESEIVKLVSSEIAAEIRNAFLREIAEGAEKIEVPDAAVGILDSAYTDVLFEINKASSDIARSTRRGAGNVLVCSPLFVSYLQSNKDFNFVAPEEGYRDDPLDFRYAGKLNGAIEVYSSLQFLDRILIGYKGSSTEFDAGFYYCPYQLIMSSGVVANPATFQPTMTFMTRYGTNYKFPNHFRVLELK